MNAWEKVEGTPFPLGATWFENDQSFSFSLYSKHAEAVRLLLFNKQDIVHRIFEYKFDYLENKSGTVWHCRVSDVNLKDTAYYAYRVDGPTRQAGCD